MIKRNVCCLTRFSCISSFVSAVSLNARLSIKCTFAITPKLTIANTYTNIISLENYDIQYKLIEISTNLTNLPLNLLEQIYYKANFTLMNHGMTSQVFKAALRKFWPPRISPLPTAVQY